jgi:ATP-dependent exoDNAse (exonuclease V) beta subunit
MESGTGGNMSIPDAEERGRALDPQRSFIVQAPAGSGKTELLIQRYLNLLAHVDQPEAVVAITFTKKAAGEMLRRVLGALRDSAGLQPEKEHERHTWKLAKAVRERSDSLRWDLFSNPNRLRIRTIDSLCTSLAMQMPWVSRLGAPPAISEAAAPIYAEAARQTIELLESEDWTAPVQALLGHLDNNFQLVQGLIADMLARRDQWLRLLAGGGDPRAIRAALETALRNVIRDQAEKARSFIPPELATEVVMVAAEAGRNLARAGREGCALACANLTRLPGDDDSDAWLGIADTLLKKDSDWRQKLTVANGFPPDAKEAKQRCLNLIARLSGNDLLRLALAEFRVLPDGQFAEPQWLALEALVQLLPLAAAQLQVQFRQSGKADHAEVAMAAQRALGHADEPTDLALALDYQIRHLLVDEFQDTSVGQYDLLEKLIAGWEPGDGRTVFAVGDPMQSIYRFREAEVGLFLKTARDGIGAVRLELLRLTANFRSDKGIVEWVNQTFPSVLPGEEDVTTGAIPFFPSETQNPEGLSPAVSLHAFVGRRDAREAARIVELVRSAQERHATKIAILVRARSHLSAILPALRDAGLRFRAVELEFLAERPIIRDLTALTRAILHPADRIAWLAVLRAPWCGLSLADLHALAGGDLRAAMWDLITDEGKTAAMSPDGWARVARLRTVLQNAIETRAASLRNCIEGTWMALGGPACAEKASDLDDAQAFFDLIEEMEDGGTLDLAALAQRIEKLDANPDPAAGDGLQVMTIHKAKGLQFDVVIVPGLGRKTRSDDSRLMMWLVRPRLGAEPDLLLAPIHATGADHDRTFDYLKYIEARKSEYESGRMLYVAATRAKSELHLLGHVAYTEEDGAVKLKKPESSSLLARMWSVTEPEFQRKADEMEPTVEAEAQNTRTPLSLQRLRQEWSLPAPPPSISPVEPAAAGYATGPAVSFRWVGDTLRHVGTVVHQMLRRIAVDGLALWDSERIEEHRPGFISALTALGVPAAEISAAADKVVDALVRTLADERGRWLLGGDHLASVCEYPITAFVDGELVTGRLDRTFVDRRGTRWIVDYKTSAHEGGGLEDFLNHECERYRPQLERYRQLFAGLEDRPIEAGLYFPLLQRWCEIAGTGAARFVG